MVNINFKQIKDESKKFFVTRRGNKGFRGIKISIVRE